MFFISYMLDTLFLHVNYIVVLQLTSKYYKLKNFLFLVFANTYAFKIIRKTL